MSHMSVFDLDHTLVKGNSSFAFCQYLTSHGVLPRLALSYAAYCYMRYTFFNMSVRELHQNIFHQLLKGKSLALMQNHVDTFVSEYLSRHLNAAVFSRLKLAQHLGHYTLILSASPSFLVSAFAKVMQVDEWRATHYTLDQEHNLSGIASILQGEEKAEYVADAMERLSIVKENVTAYSDSYLDLPFLLTAGTPIAVRPDRKLRAISKTHAWTVIP